MFDSYAEQPCVKSKRVPQCCINAAATSKATSTAAASCWSVLSCPNPLREERSGRARWEWQSKMKGKMSLSKPANR